MFLRESRFQDIPTSNANFNFPLDHNNRFHRKASELHSRQWRPPSVGSRTDPIQNAETAVWPRCGETWAVYELRFHQETRRWRVYEGMRLLYPLHCGDLIMFGLGNVLCPSFCKPKFNRQIHVGDECKKPPSLAVPNSPTIKVAAVCTAVGQASGRWACFIWLNRFGGWEPRCMLKAIWEDCLVDL